MQEREKLMIFRTYRARKAKDKLKDKWKDKFMAKSKA
jgi:hypothetical protein